MTTQISPHTTIAEFVRERPSRSRIFEKLSIDYCCGGKLTLEEACSRKGLDANSVLATIEALEAAAGSDANEDSIASMSPTELCDAIEATHHVYLQEELPRLEYMINKVSGKHAERWPWTVELAREFAALKGELLLHLMKEEKVLFPAIRDIEAGRPVQSACGDHLEHPVAMMEHEHESAGAALARMREISGNYTPPDEACNTFRAVLDGFEELEKDTHQHIHKENNILFPAALEMVKAG